MADASLDMRLYQVRLDTFGKESSPSKKRRSSGGGAITKSWPHVTPVPDDLAFAGFYFNPSSHAEDNVNCFHCRVKLDGWEIDDVPIKEHLAHSPECAWALCTSVTLENEDRDPMSEQLLKARLATFGDSWPYEKKRGWKCKSKKLAEAGWCMDPSMAGEDGTTCFYCNLSLDGWEPKDDPTVEHKKRQPDCPFFALVERFAGSRPKKSRARTSTASKASRLSIQSTFSEAPSFMSLGEAGVDMEGDTSIASVMSTASTTKGRKTAAPKKGGRVKKKAAETPNVDTTEMVTALEDTIPVVQTMIDETLEQAEEEIQPETGKKPAKGKGRAKKTAATAPSTQEIQDTVEEVPQVEDKKAAAKPKRGKKRTSDGEEKAATVEPEVVPAPVEVTPAKPKKTKAVKGKKVKAAAEEEVQPPVEAMEIDQLEPETVAAQEPTKPKRGRKPKATKTTKAPTPEPQPQREPSVALDGDDDSENFVVHGDDNEEDNYVVRDAPADEFEPSPTPKKPSTAKAATPKAAIESKASTPRSAHSTAYSDAENHPPSSIPAASQAPILPPAPSPPTVLQAPLLSPTKTTRIPLASQTPNRSASPQKLGALKTTTPWTATDIDTVFLAGQENDSGSVARRLADLGGQLSSPERRMTVEEWVRFQAARGEERLREECERMVWVVEREGTRALGVLGGLEVRN